MWKTEFEASLEQGLKVLEMPLNRRIYREELLLGANIDVQTKSGNPYDLKAKKIALENPSDLPLFKRTSQINNGFFIDYNLRDDNDNIEDVETAIEFIIANKKFSEECIFLYYNLDIFKEFEEFEYLEDSSTSLLSYLGISNNGICSMDVYVEKTKKECADQGCKKVPDFLYEKFGEQLERLKQKFDGKEVKPGEVVKAILDIIKNS